MKKIALLMIMIMAFISLPLTSCKSKSTNAVALESCSWFAAEDLEVIPPSDDAVVNFFIQNDCSFNGRYFADLFMYVVDNDMVERFEAGEDVFYETEYVSYITEYDISTGKSISNFDWESQIDTIRPSDSMVDASSICGMLPDGDDIIVFLRSFLRSSIMNDARLDSFRYDPDKKKISDYKIYDIGDESAEFTNFVKIDDKYVFAEKHSVDAELVFDFIVMDNSGIQKTIRLNSSKDFHPDEIKNYIINGDELEVQFDAFENFSYKSVTARINLSSGTAEVLPDAGLFNSAGNTLILNGSDTYSVKEDGIYRFSTAAKTMEKMIDFNYSDINIYSANNSRIVMTTEDTVVMLEKQLHTACMMSSLMNYTFHVIRGSDQSPYDGKTKITVSDINSSIDYATAEAIRNFNKTNENYYVEVKIYAEDENLSGLYALSDISNRVLVDIASGDSTDVILNGASYSELNDSRYLMDLSTLMETDFYDDEMLFSNVIEASYVGDSLYQLPLTFNLRGIRTNASNNSDYGFDFDEYKNFVSTVTNGFDPINEYCQGDKSMYLNELEGPFIKNSIDYSTLKVDFNTPEFKAIADYIKYLAAIYDENYLPYRTIEPYIDYQDAYYEELWPVQIMRATYHFGETNLVCGIPTTSDSAYGAQAIIKTSAAISKDCSNVEGAWEFVKYLISEEGLSCCSTQVIPVNRAAYDNLMDHFIEQLAADVRLREIEFNCRIDIEFADAFALVVADESMVDDLTKNIEAVHQIYSTDATIMIVINEEIPAYLENQKEWDEVVSIINNRVNTIINERG